MVVLEDLLPRARDRRRDRRGLVLHPARLGSAARAAPPALSHEARPLGDRGRDRPWRRGRRLPRPRPRRESGRGQGRPRGAGRRRPSLRARGAAPGLPRRGRGFRPGPRRGLVAGDALHRHAVPPGRHAPRAAPPGPAPGRGGPRGRTRPRARPRSRARARDRAPGREAGERPVHGEGQAAPRRPGAREALRPRRPRSEPERLALGPRRLPRHDRIHRARAARGREDRGAAGRRLLPRSRALRVPRGEAGLRGRLGARARGPLDGRQLRARPAPPPGDAARARRGGRARPRARPARALRGRPCLRACPRDGREAKEPPLAPRPRPRPPPRGLRRGRRSPRAAGPASSARSRRLRARRPRGEARPPPGHGRGGERRLGGARARSGKRRRARAPRDRPLLRLRQERGCQGRGRRGRHADAARPRRLGPPLPRGRTARDRRARDGDGSLLGARVGGPRRHGAHLQAVR